MSRLLGQCPQLAFVAAVGEVVVVDASGFRCVPVRRRCSRILCGRVTC